MTVASAGSGGSFGGSGGSVTLGQATGTITLANGSTINGDLIINTTARVNLNDNTKTYGGSGSIKILGSALGSGSGGAAISGNGTGTVAELIRAALQILTKAR